MKRNSFLPILAALILVLFVPSCSQETMQGQWQRMHDSKEQSLKEFNDAKFGMFIHWGLYSEPAGIWKGEKIEGLGEWIMYHAQIPRDEYRELARTFNPVKFNAEEWVSMAKQAGMRYIVAMPKHHDGFAMYDSEVTDYDIMDATPFGRDPMEELYNECKRQGIRFGVYYSHSIDWMDGGDAGLAQQLKIDPEHKDHYATNLWDPSPVSYQDYIKKKAKPQVTEIMTKFPDLIEIWYDFPRWMNEEQSFDFYKLAYQLQPGCMVNSRVGNDFGDYLVAGDNQIPETVDPRYTTWETPGTLNNTWGIKSYDTDWKTIEELLYWICEITSKGGNYLLNVGPTAEGLFPEESVRQLEEIGEWMSINGESVYGTVKWEVKHEGPYDMEMKSTTERKEKGFNAGFSPKDFWFSMKDGNVYVSSLMWPENSLVNIKSFALENIKDRINIVSVQMLGYDKSLDWVLKDDGLQVVLPAFHPSEKGYVLKVLCN